jgi:hypothetical protein
MNNSLSNVGAVELRRAAKLKEKITKLTKELDAILGGSSPTPARKKHTMSAAGRAAIRAAQKARWAKIKAAKKA